MQGRQCWLRCSGIMKKKAPGSLLHVREAVVVDMQWKHQKKKCPQLTFACEGGSGGSDMHHLLAAGALHMGAPAQHEFHMDLCCFTQWLLILFLNENPSEWRILSVTLAWLLLVQLHHLLLSLKLFRNLLHQNLQSPNQNKRLKEYEFKKGSQFQKEQWVFFFLTFIHYFVVVFWLCQWWDCYPMPLLWEDRGLCWMPQPWLWKSGHWILLYLLFQKWEG